MTYITVLNVIAANTKMQDHEPVAVKTMKLGRTHTCKSTGIPVTQG
jgi:hypothetical protein